MHISIIKFYLQMQWIKLVSMQILSAEKNQALLVILYTLGQSTTMLIPVSNKYPQ